jgi:hypothetical protein
MTESNPASNQTAVRQGLGEFYEDSRKKEGKQGSGEHMAGILISGVRGASAEGN